MYLCISAVSICFVLNELVMFACCALTTFFIASLRVGLECMTNCERSETLVCSLARIFAIYLYSKYSGQ